MVLPRSPLLILTFLSLVLAALIGIADAASLRKAGKSLSPSHGKAKKVHPYQHHKFCYRYRLACIQAASADKATWGEEAVVFSCQKSKRNAIYTMGCRYSGKDYTSAALARIAFSGGVTTSIVDGGTATITSTIRATATSYAIATATDTDTQFTTTSTSTTSTVPETTQVTTTRTDISTETSITSIVTSTETDTIPYISTTFTTINTAAQVNTQVFPVGVYQIASGNSLPARAVQVAEKRGSRSIVDPSIFCTAYTTACSAECSRVRSTPRYQVCLQDKYITGRYSLSCYCQNNRVETQHALANAGKQAAVSVVSSLSTSQTTVTTTATTVVPTTVTTVQTTLATVTSTDVATTTSTSTIKATSVTATTTSTLTSAGYVTTTATSSPIATVTGTVASSTIYVVAPTGIIRVLGANDAPKGYLGVSSATTTRYGAIAAKADAYSFVVTRDAPSGLLRFQEVVSGLFFGGEVGFSGATFAQNSDAYAWLTRQSVSPAQPGAPAGTGTYTGSNYETWIVNTVAIPPAGAALGSVELLPAWINPDGTKYASSTAAWNSEGTGDYFLDIIADGPGLAAAYGASSRNPLRLFFGPA